jgi:adenylate cyclase
MPRRHHVSSREIERKFLIKALPVEILRSRHFKIAQGYLANEPGGRHVRLRKKARTASLTFKVNRGGGSSREEREIKLSAQQFATLWPATAGRRLHKTRYLVPWRSVVIEIDIYHGRNRGIMSRKSSSPVSPVAGNSNRPRGLGEK